MKNYDLKSNNNNTSQDHSVQQTHTYRAHIKLCNIPLKS